MKKVLRTQRNILKTTKRQTEVIKKLSHHSAKLYNTGLYNIRQHFFQTKKYLPYTTNYHESKESIHYKMLLTDHGQQVLKIIERDFKSFFALLKLKREGKYEEKVNVPRYKKDPFAIVITGRSVRIKKGYVFVGLSKTFKEVYNPGIKDLKFKLPKNIKADKLKELRIIPFGNKFEINFVYEKEIEIRNNLNKNNYLSIDLGVDNLATCFDSSKRSSFIIDGRFIKSINARYNKEKARLQAIYDRQGVKNSKKLTRISLRRKNLIDNYFNHAVLHIVRYCEANNIGSLVIGDFTGIKNGIRIGKRNNQNFVGIPFVRFLSKLETKCQEFGIDFHRQEESYSSKCSYLDGEEVCKHKSYAGRRVRRGLFRSAQGVEVNADLNGAMNILVKFLKSNDQSGHHVLANRSGCVNHPSRLKPGQLLAA